MTGIFMTSHRPHPLKELVIYYLVMPYVFVSTLIRLENGPTIVGDEWSDPELMGLLGAELVNEFGNNFKEYRTQEAPRIVLNKLELQGYKVIAMTGVSQTCIWTLHKEP